MGQMNPEQSNFFNIQQYVQQFFSAAKVSNFVLPELGDLIWIFSEFMSPSMKHISHQTGTQFLKSVMEIICTCSEQLPSVDVLISSAISSKTLVQVVN